MPKVTGSDNLLAYEFYSGTTGSFSPLALENG
jgi:hypothetical protein